MMVLITFTMLLYSTVSIALCVVVSLFTVIYAGSKRVTKQVGTSVNGPVSSTNDHQSAETGHGFGLGHGHGHGLGHGLGHHGHGDGKYFQYAHNPAYDEYEYGYRRGNDYHFQERYERGGPYWNFKTKVKWGDKYGGYGEHYWDYNHSDKSHHGDDHGHGHGHGHGHDGHDGHYSEPVEAYEPKPGTKSTGLNKRHSDNNTSKKINNETSLETSQAPSPSTLSLDPVTGKVTDESSGKTYWLKPAPTSTSLEPKPQV